MPTRSNKAARALLHPHRREALRMRWDERLVESPAPGQCRITVPLLGPEPAPELGFRLANALTKLWVGFPTADGGTVKSVATHVRSIRTRSHLVVLITTEYADGRERIDTPLLARQLSEALHDVSLHGDGDPNDARRHGMPRLRAMEAVRRAAH